MKNPIVKDTFALTLITLVAGLLLGLVYDITATPIANEQAKAKAEAYKAVFAQADDFQVISDKEDPDLEKYLDENGYSKSTVDEVMQAVDENGEPIG
ncbi:MAG: FMN-binding protein, partial [Blautia sp.]